MKITRKALWLSAAATAGIIGAGLIWLILTQTDTDNPPAQVADNISRNYKTCLLDTTSTPTTDLTWQTVQKAAHGQPINAQHITAPNAPTEQLLPYANQLIVQHCDLIIINGANLTDTARKLATDNPNHPLITVGGTTNPPNTTNLPNTTPDNANTLIQLITTHAR